MSIALDQSAISTALSRLADQLFLDAGTDTIDLVGIRRRGDEVSERVAALLKEKGANVRLGVLDISLYRDDFEHLHENPLLQSSEIDFSIDGSRVILVDDVIFTGRTIRAALDAIFDYGRPAAVELAVLIDRGHRELPIEPRYVGATLETDRLDHVRVGLMKTDGEDVVELTQK
ncbi:bifunctional pyr operon transcriptional regulator/uracil phosphoribosyltransferase PyrR [Akkermansiaceae bacterium]|jgi:pyrimidine operon attenuation protein/uracil phosphoribosyltransferase|nr:bifunctional pyr operon transcriptional regulator/uracil phosphoribosyltransferase PyrR [Akkermansiaceae bacterium]MDB4519457.1 bifunctional pyr operon transcriptional regulator/uracil phosphoribosyltransferase PyrR [Akkermansiaceae bacterium]|tara:strand:+ start:32 stop:553 length:522 start_codon:yes stop_codon:yes gene_type:complete